VAGEVRERDGGLPGVKALGLRVGGRVQVSMNLTDLKRTSVPLALEAVRVSADILGAGVESTELVGLMPLAAVLETARYYLALPELGPEQVLEAGLWRDRSLGSEFDSRDAT
jgi:glutamate formiminotransferase